MSAVRVDRPLGAVPRLVSSMIKFEGWSRSGHVLLSLVVSPKSRVATGEDARCHGQWPGAHRRHPSSADSRFDEIPSR